MKSLLRFAYVIVAIANSSLWLAACGKVDIPAAQSGGAISSSAVAGSTSSGFGASSTAGVSSGAMGTGGSAASNASSTGAASSTGGSGGGSACPAQQDVGKACSTAGQKCFYGACCPVEIQCNGGVWQMIDTDCPGLADCPIAPPTNGASCDVCFQMSPCSYSCPGAGTSVTATCNGTTWSVDATCPSTTTASASSGGSCGQCMTNFLCCNGACINPNDDILNCGGCNLSCGGAHPYCDGGKCGTPACTGATCSTAEFCCGQECCTAGQLCCAVPGPVTTLLPQCTAPVNGSCPAGCTDCVCASPDTPIATPRGDRAIADLNVGDLVYSVEHEAIVAVPLLRTNHTAVHDHHVVRVKLATGVVLEISPRHPTADGRTFGDLREGDSLDGIAITSVALVAYTHPYTYDILPASDTHTYFAGGALVGSTLAGR